MPFGFRMSIQPVAGITFVGSNSHQGSGSSMGVPAGMQQGDLLLLWRTQAESETVNLPSGYTNIAADTSGFFRGRVCYKMMGSTPDTSISLNSLVSSGAICMAFRGVNTSSPLDGTGSISEINLNSVSGMNSPTITTTQPNSLVVILVGTYTTGLVTKTPPAGYETIIAQEVNISAGNGHVAAIKKVAAAGTETPGSWTPTWSGGSVTCLVATVGLRKAT